MMTSKQRLVSYSVWQVFRKSFCAGLLSFLFLISGSAWVWGESTPLKPNESNKDGETRGEKKSLPKAYQQKPGVKVAREGWGDNMPPMPRFAPIVMPIERIDGPPKKDLRQMTTLAEVLSTLWKQTPRRKPLVRDDHVTRRLKKVAKYFGKGRKSRLLLMLDRPLYRPSDVIWLRTLELMQMGNQPRKELDAMVVQLVSPKGKVIQQRMIATKGWGGTQLRLPTNCPGGEYKIRVKTYLSKRLEEKKFTVSSFQLPQLKKKLRFVRKAYGPSDRVKVRLEVKLATGEALKNQLLDVVVRLGGKVHKRWKAETDQHGKASLFFVLPKKLKTDDGLLTVLIRHGGVTESISRPIPLVLRNILVGLFPEGGSLVEGLSSRVYFAVKRLLDGKPVDVDGRIEEEKTGNVVAKFRSFHDGMGRFSLRPQPGVSYVFRVTRPKGISEAFVLPKAKPTGVTMRYVDDFQSERPELSVLVESQKEKKVVLVALQHETILAAQTFTLESGTQALSLSPEFHWRGVTRLTLFDAKMKPLAERLVFRQKGKGLQVHVRPNKPNYRPGDTVTLSIEVRSPNGQRMPHGLFATSVVDDTLLSFADDHEPNWLAQRFLTRQLVGEIFRPNVYFEPKEKKAAQAIDLVMGVHGWRDFSWKRAFGGKAKKPNPDLYTLKPRDVRRKLGLGGSASGGKEDVVGRRQRTEDLGWIRRTMRRFKRKRKRDVRGLFAQKKKSMKTKARKAQKKEADLKKKMAKQMPRRAKNQRDGVSALAPSKPAKAVVSETSRVQNYRELRKRARLQEKRVRPNSDDTMARRKRVRRPPMNVPTRALRSSPGVALGGLSRRDRNRSRSGERIRFFGGVYRGTWGGFTNSRQFRKAYQTYRKKKALELRRAWLQQWSNQSGYFQPYNNRYVRVGKYRRWRRIASPAIHWDVRPRQLRRGSGHVSFRIVRQMATSYRVRVIAVGSGMLGMKDITISTKKPLQMRAKIPLQVSEEDALVVPVTLVNTTRARLPVLLEALIPSAFAYKGLRSQKLVLEERQAKTLFFSLRANVRLGDGTLHFQAKSRYGVRSVKETVQIRPRGYPRSVMWSGTLDGRKNKSVTFKLPEDFRAEKDLGDLSIYGHPLGTVTDGMASMLREPHGCFEQTSSSNYPNIMMMQFLKRSQAKEPQLMAKAKRYLAKGYNRLIGFETAQGGFSLYGRGKGSPLMTAYGLMQFEQMRRVVSFVDTRMIRRNRKWLLRKRNAQGNFFPNEPIEGKPVANAVHSLLKNAFVLFALYDSGQRGLKKELALLVSQAKQMNDPYFQALVTFAMWKEYGAKHPKVRALAGQLLRMQKRDGSFRGRYSSGVRSHGNNLHVETTSIAIFTLLGLNIPLARMMRAVVWLRKQRRYGRFGATQATVMALRALLAVADRQTHLISDGTLSLQVNQNPAVTKSYKKTQMAPVTIPLQRNWFRNGNNKVTIGLQAKAPVPFQFALHYYTFQPTSTKKAKLGVTTQLDRHFARMGELIRLTVTLKNRTNKEVYAPMARIRFPGALRHQEWQLKNLRKRGEFALYETQPREITLYFESFPANATKTLSFDLVARMTGNYSSSASSAYLYYEDDSKSWTKPLWVSIRP